MAENVDQISQDLQSEAINPLASVRWVPVKNVGSDDLPAGCLLAVNGYDADSIAQVAAPAADSQVGLLVNGPTALIAGSYGQAHNTFPCSVLYETGEGTPAIGNEMGTVTGDPKLHLKKTGYIVQGLDPGGGEHVVVIEDSGNLAGHGYQSGRLPAAAESLDHGEGRQTRNHVNASRSDLLVLLWW